MTYTTIDDAIQKIVPLSPETLFANIDIKDALRLIPIHPAGRVRVVGMCSLLRGRWLQWQWPPEWLPIPCLY